jgi:hypothetical protein
MNAQLPLQALRAGVSHLRKNPTRVLSAAKHAVGLRMLIPLDALRWLVENLGGGKKAPKDVVIGANPPSLSFGATVDLMGNAIRVESDIRVEDFTVGQDELRISLRLGNFKLNALDPKSPAAMLFKSLDLTKPANLMNFMPKRPEAIVEADADRFVIDLLRVPKLAENPIMRRVLDLLGPLVEVREIRTEGDDLLIGWRPRPAGIMSSMASLRKTR